MARVAVVGPGSVGLYFMAFAAGAGHDVIGCARRPFDHMVVDSESTPYDGPATVATSPADIPWSEPADWVLVGVKAHQTDGAIPWFDRLCGPQTNVVVMQNGVEGEARLTPLTRGATVIPAVVYCGAELLEPGHIQHFASGRLIVPATPEADALRDLFAGTPVEIDVSEKHLTSAWVKLAINVVANGLTALTGQPMRVLGRPDIAAVARALFLEAWTVGRAEGAELDLDGADQIIEAMATRGEGLGGTSMLYDTRAGRPTEHDALHGAVLRAARRHGIPTPTLDIIHALLAARSDAPSVVQG